MIKTLHAKNFKAVPYLEASTLMQGRPRGISFSTTKPNVLVGQNGAGKSALLTTLALQTLSYFTGVSAFDDRYTRGRDADSFWEKVREWGRDFKFLPGLKCETDLGPALYFRPGHIPGNESCITTAMMCGYMEEARTYAKLTEDKSSGQKTQATLQRVLEALKGDLPSLGYQHINWSAGKALRELSRDRYCCDFEYQAEHLKRTYTANADAIPVLLLDEPEQSLDARAEAQLWADIAQADCSSMQIIVASHSLYPLMHPDRFNLIEAVPGYADEVRALMI